MSHVYQCCNIHTTRAVIDMIQIIDAMYEHLRLFENHLNAIHTRIESSTTLLDKVNAKIEWQEGRDFIVGVLQDMVDRLQSINTEPMSEKQTQNIEDLRADLFYITILNIKEGFVRESSFSETGRLSEFFSEFQSISKYETV